MSVFFNKEKDFFFQVKIFFWNKYIWQMWLLYDIIYKKNLFWNIYIFNVQILNEAVCISHQTNAFVKDWNPSLLFPSKSRIVGQTGIFISEKEKHWALFKRICVTQVHNSLVITLSKKCSWFYKYLLHYKQINCVDSQMVHLFYLTAGSSHIKVNRRVRYIHCFWKSKILFRFDFTFSETNSELNLFLLKKKLFLYVHDSCCLKMTVRIISVPSVLIRSHSENISKII